MNDYFMRILVSPNSLLISYTLYIYVFIPEKQKKQTNQPRDIGGREKDQTWSVLPNEAINIQ